MPRSLSKQALLKLKKAERKKREEKKCHSKKSESYNLAQHQYWFANFLPNSLGTLTI